MSAVSNAANRRNNLPTASVRACSIYGVNQLPEPEKRSIYRRLIPAELRERFSISPDFCTPDGAPLLNIKAAPDSSVAEIALYHQPGFADPVFYGLVSDSVVGQIQILMYVLNDPHAPRFNIDCLPGGRLTEYGTACRNLPAEAAALSAGLLPGQVRRGLGILKSTVRAFEDFVLWLGHDLYFADPLFYHNAVIFERHGFAYEKGRKIMEKIHQGFSTGGEFRPLLDGSSSFRRPEAAESIRLRSWAIHDGVMGEPFTNVTMYKRIGRPAQVNTCPAIPW